MRPGTMSIFPASDGTQNEWMTSGDSERHPHAPAGRDGISLAVTAPVPG
ncbi:MAG: hypothetical protein R2746_03320 [Acidimicrobiales bacterium]